MSKLMVKHQGEVSTNPTFCRASSNDDGTFYFYFQLPKWSDASLSSTTLSRNDTGQVGLVPIKEETDQDSTNRDAHKSQWPPEARVVPSPTGGKLRKQDQHKVLQEVLDEAFEIARISMLLEDAWPDPQSPHHIRNILGRAANTIGIPAARIHDRFSSDLPFARAVFSMVSIQRYFPSNLTIQRI